MHLFRIVCNENVCVKNVGSGVCNSIKHTIKVEAEVESINSLIDDGAATDFEGGEVLQRSGKRLFLVWNCVRIALAPPGWS